MGGKEAWACFYFFLPPGWGGGRDPKIALEDGIEVIDWPRTKLVHGLGLNSVRCGSNGLRIGED